MNEIKLSSQSPLFHATHADRYERQSIIREYEQKFSCRLMMVFDIIGAWGITYLEDLLYDMPKDEDLHMILVSPGGDGESAIRMARSIQSRCHEFSVVVPDQAKSAATLLALGAHSIIMGPTSDLGPIDPQLQVNPNSNQLISAKNIIAAVENAAEEVKKVPETLPLYASLLSNVNALMLQQAKAAMNQSKTLLKEALESQPNRSSEQVDDLSMYLQQKLIEVPDSHSAPFGAEAAKQARLCVKELPGDSEQWQMIWRLWTKYFVLGQRIYEGNRVSHSVGSWNH